MLIAEVMTLEMYKAACERDVNTFKNNCLELDATVAAKTRNKHITFLLCEAAVQHEEFLMALGIVHRGCNSDNGRCM